MCTQSVQNTCLSDGMNSSLRKLKEHFRTHRLSPRQMETCSVQHPSLGRTSHIAGITTPNLSGMVENRIPLSLLTALNSQVQRLPALLTDPTNQSVGSWTLLWKLWRVSRIVYRKIKPKKKIIWKLQRCPSAHFRVTGYKVPCVENAF